MCMMTVKFAAECGGETIMENVASLSQSGDGVELIDLFGEHLHIGNAQLKQADFEQGTTWILVEQPR